MNCELAIQSGTQLDFNTPQALRQDRVFVLHAIQNQHTARYMGYKNLPKPFQADTDIALSQANARPYQAFNILYENPTLQNKKAIALVLASNDYHTMGLISEELRDDDDVVWTSIKHYACFYPMCLASPRIRRKPAYWIAQLCQCIPGICFILEEPDAQAAIALGLVVCFISHFALSYSSEISNYASTYVSAAAGTMVGYGFFDYKHNRMKAEIEEQTEPFTDLAHYENLV